MKTYLKKIVSLITVISILSVVSVFSITANASEQQKVRVIVKNETLSVNDGANWQGVLVDEYVNIDNTSTGISVVVDALAKNNYSCVGAENKYISSINGLSAGTGGYMTGWIVTLNDWFTNQGIGAYTVADGTLQNNDEVCFVFSCNFGGDCGSSWGNTDSSLKSVDFSDGVLSQQFSPTNFDYTLTLPSNVNSIKVTPTASNKNYQVRTYKNEYTPAVDNSEYKRNDTLTVKDGDCIYIGVGNSNWPSMNKYEKESVYKITIQYESSIVLGDVDNDGTLSINDCTLIQKYITKINENIDTQVADYNQDNSVNILDVTDIQKSICKL